MIEKLPDSPPSKKHLLETVQKCLKDGSVVVNKPADYSTCPECGNPAKYFQQQVIDDEDCQILITFYPACGWSQGTGVARKIGC